MKAMLESFRLRPSPPLEPPRENLSVMLSDMGLDERFVNKRGLTLYENSCTFLVGVLFAASPLVDAAFIPMGIIRYSPLKSYLALYTGKFVWILSVLYIARQSKQIVDQFFGENVYASIVSAALVLSTAYLIISVDWEKRLLGHKDSLRSRLLGRLRNLLSREQRSDGQGPGQQDKAS